MKSERVRASLARAEDIVRRNQRLVGIGISIGVGRLFVEYTARSPTMQIRDPPLTVAPPNVTFHPDALADAREAAAYDSERVQQLGDECISELRRIVTLAAERPELGAPMRAGRRRWLFRRFKFAVVYRIAPDGSVRVLAVAHHKRRPGYWRART